MTEDTEHVTDQDTTTEGAGAVPDAQGDTTGQTGDATLADLVKAVEGLRFGLEHIYDTEARIAENLCWVYIHLETIARAFSPVDVDHPSRSITQVLQELRYVSDAIQSIG